MRVKQNVFVIVLAVVLAAVGFGVWRTRPTPPPAAQNTRRSAIDRNFTVDQTSLVTAQRLVRMPTTAEERSFADDALRIADQEMDLAFAQAVRRASSQPAAKSPEITALSDQLQQALRAAAADQARVTDLTAAVSKAGPATLQSLTDQLELAKAQAALDSDQIDDARGDLQRAGGDPKGRIQAIVADHEAASKASDSTHVNITAAPERRGMLQQMDGWFSLSAKRQQLDDAQHFADSLSQFFQKRHDALEARMARVTDSVRATLTHDSSATLIELTRQQAVNEKARSTYDSRVDDQRRLSSVYGGWSAVVATQARSLENGLFRGLAWIIGVILVGILMTRWVEHVVGARIVDRRRVQTTYMITRAAVQVICVLFILLVIFGPPSDVGTVLGLAGAGLTVALKDFIIGFLGWFVLMGKSGIRVGDLVEINGVTGEVIEIGMFYTVLLETGAWSESQPTGRRVTFTNSFAIEGHYFNFSTSGRWMWDEVRIEVPEGRDPHPLVDAFTKEVQAATSETARQAEEEWKVARRSPNASAIEAAPSITLRPAGKGFEVAARYITQAAERDEMRSKLYHIAIEVLSAKDSTAKYTPSVARTEVPSR